MEARRYPPEVLLGIRDAILFDGVLAAVNRQERAEISDRHTITRFRGRRHVGVGETASRRDALSNPGFRSDEAAG